MKKLIPLFSFLLLFQYSFSQTSGWEQLNGPYTPGNISCMLNNNGVMYAGTGGGMYVSANRGVSWANKSAGLADWGAAVNNMAAIGNKVFATVDDGLVYSADQGNTWTYIRRSGLIYFQTYYALQTLGNNIFVGTVDSGLFASYDAGATWRWSGNSIRIKSVSSIFATPGKIIVYGQDSAYDNLCRMSVDSGKTWALPQDTAFYNYAGYMYNYGGKQYGQAKGKTYVSNDNGGTWQLTALNWPTPEQFAFKGKYIYGVDYNETVHISADSGKTWRTKNPTTPGIWSNANGFAVSGDTLLVGDNDYGMSISKDTGKTWATANTGILNSWITALTLNGKYIFAATDKWGVYLSKDDGNTWTEADKNLGITPNALAARNDTVYAGGGGGMYITTNNGAAWKAINTGIASGTTINAIGIQGNNIYIGGGSSPCVAYLSTNGGASWQLIDTNLAYSDNITAFAFVGDTVFATGGANVYASYDHGKHWNTVQSGYGYNGIAAFGRNLCVGVDDVKYSKNAGQTWNYCYTCSFNRDDIEVIGAVSDTFYAGDGFGGMYMSADTGKTWYNSSPIEFSVNTFATGNGSIYMGGYYSGVWKHFSTNGVATAVGDKPGPGNLRVYPNPAASFILINTGAEAEHETLAVYDLMGRLITQQSASQPLTWLDVKNYPSGVFLLKTTDDNGNTQQVKWVKE